MKLIVGLFNNKKKHRYTLFCSMLGDASIVGGIGLKNVFVLLG